MQRGRDGPSPGKGEYEDLEGGQSRFPVLRTIRNNSVLAVAVASVLVLAFGGLASYLDRRAHRQTERVMFAEEFDSLDTNRWKMERGLDDGGNGEFQAYTDDPAVVFVRDGKLVIQPRPMSADAWAHLTDADAKIAAEALTGSSPTKKQMARMRKPGGMRHALTDGTPLEVARCTVPEAQCKQQSRWDWPMPPAVSAKLTTKGSFAFTYGTLEARMRLPMGDWLWAGFWLLSQDDEYGTWPYSGELDIIEQRGNANWTLFGSQQHGDAGSNRFAGSIHCAAKDGTDSYAVHNESLIGELADDEGFVILGLARTPGLAVTYARDPTSPTGRREMIRWTPGDHPGQPHCDNDVYQGNEHAPFDKPFYVIINVAVGGAVAGGENYWGSTSPWHKCNHEKGCDPRSKFFDLQDEWLPTWTRPMEIDWIRVFTPGPPLV